MCWILKWLIDFKMCKTQLISFDSLINSAKKKQMGLLLMKIILMVAFSSKLDWSSYIASIANTASKKIGSLICSMIFFFLLRVCFITMNLPYDLARNTIAMSGSMLLIATIRAHKEY